MRLFAAFLVMAYGILSYAGVKDNFQVKSPDGKIDLKLTLAEGKIQYRINWKNREVLETSSLEIFPGAEVSIRNSVEREHESNWKPVWGQFSTIQDHFRELELEIESKEVKGKFLARAYNDGVAFRFVLDEGPKSGEATFSCSYALPEGSSFYVPYGETEPKGPLSLADLFELQNIKTNTGRQKHLEVPVVGETPDHCFLALLESDLYAAEGFQVMHVGADPENGKLISHNKVRLGEEALVSPWRVILLGESAGDLLTSTTTVNLATPCKLENTDWIKPGKTLWDWRVHGYTAPDGFVYGINTESYLRFIDFAEAYDVEYFLIDAGWYGGHGDGKFVVRENLDMEQVRSYAEEKGVGLILYYDRKGGDFGDDQLFPYYQSLGAHGIKYGFMGKNVPFTREAIRLSAESELLIDFHDGPLPFTGIRRTYPNAVTREYCHAQQDSRRAFTPESFLKMALINAITGPLDMNNGNFDITGINKGQREKGPRITDSYPSTAVSEAARTLVIFSGLVCIPDAPEAYKAKIDLFEFIQKQPVGLWDESRILNSSIGEYITTARRSGDEWFIGSVISQQGGTLDIALDFLEEGLEYQATYYEDTEETHCITNPEAYRVRTGRVKKGDLIKAELAPGGGHCMWIRPIPNIVVVIADDMAWADVGYNGQLFFETPHIDQLAADGMRFNHAYSGASVCSPSRACLISGMYSPRHSIYHPGNRARGKLEYMKLAVPNRVVKNETYDWFSAIGDLAPDVNSLAKVLNSAGYVTARYGKWHVGRDEQGFDISQDIENGYRDKDGTKLLTDGGIEFLRENKDRPFFLYMSYYDVHKPFAADSAVIAKYKTKLEQEGGDFDPVYAAMMEAVDTGVGRLRTELRRLGLEDNTLFIFTSDNGGFPDITSNLPLHGYKGTLFEGGIRIPTCMVWPDRIKPGTNCDIPITFVDYLPTFAELAGASLAQSRYPVDGVSMLPLMKGGDIPERAIFWHFPLYANIDHGVHPGTFPVYGTDKLYWRGVPATVIRRGKYKLIYYYEDQSVKLFDVVNDMGETKDLSKERPEIATRLLAELKAWTTSVHAPVPDRINPAFNPNN